jgi:hypothetical protein
MFLAFTGLPWLIVAAVTMVHRATDAAVASRQP